MRSLFIGTLTTLLLTAAFGYETSVGRLSYMEGEVWMLKDGAMNWINATPNMLIEEGDIIETGRRARAEIELGMGATLWMNGNTRIEILTLYYDEASISIPLGCVRAKNMRDNRLWVETENASIYIDNESDARIEVERDGRVEVYLFEGYATVEAAEDIVKVRRGDRIYVSMSGRIKERHGNRIDGFDRFCRYRGERYGRLNVDIGIFIGASDLDLYGTWVTVPAYGRVWRPRVVVGWRPYLCGYWFWDMAFGWVWISYEPWGFLPYHYGHWVWCSPCGWVWVPGRVWAPAWVVWVHYGPYIGWAPVGPDCKPCNAPDSWTYVTRESFYKKTIKHPVDYKECLIKHPIYEVKDDIRKRWKNVELTGAPEPADAKIAMKKREIADKEKALTSHDEIKVTKKTLCKTRKVGIPVRDGRPVSQTKKETRDKTKGLRRDEVSIPTRKTAVEGVKSREKRKVSDKIQRKKKDEERIIKPMGKSNKKHTLTLKKSDERRNSKLRSQK